MSVKTTKKEGKAGKERSTRAAVAKPVPPKKPAAGRKRAPVPKKSAEESRPTTGRMVLEAVRSLSDRQGSSLAAIKKYMTETYAFDAGKSAHLVRKYLSQAVEAGVLIRTKGKGASGSFKIGLGTEAKKQPAQPKVKIPALLPRTKVKAIPVKTLANVKVPAKKAPAAAKNAVPGPKEVKVPTKKAPATVKNTVPGPEEVKVPAKKSHATAKQVVPNTEEHKAPATAKNVVSVPAEVSVPVPSSVAQGKADKEPKPKIMLPKATKPKIMLPKRVQK